VTAAVLVSLFVSFTLDPMLSSIWTTRARSRGWLRFKPLKILLDRVRHFVQWMHALRAPARLASGAQYRLWLPRPTPIRFVKDRFRAALDRRRMTISAARRRAVAARSHGTGRWRFGELRRRRAMPRIAT